MVKCLTSIWVKRLPYLGIYFQYFDIGIKYAFSCVNVRQVPRKVLKTEAGVRGFQHLPRGLANVNALKNDEMHC